MNCSAVIRQEGEFFVALCPELDVASQGKTSDEALANLKEAVTLYLEDEDAQRPDPTPLVVTFAIPDGADPDPVRA